MGIRSPAERDAAENFLRAGKQYKQILGISLRERESRRVCDLDLQPTVTPAILRRLERDITAAGPSGVSGWLMERSILPRGNKAAVGEQTSSKQQPNGDT